MSVPIRLVRCAKTFPDGTKALEPLDLEIAAGETLAVLGPSGCGKTTTLRLIAGLDFPDPGGKVIFGADDVTDLPIEKRNVGMVFQSYALFPNMSVARNVAYGLEVRRKPAAEIAARVAEMLAMTGLTEFANRRIDQLSGGQRQRVALARAIAPAPRILLLDEPLTALDAKLRDRLRADIDRLLRGLGITAIYVTHDQAEAMALGDRVAVMDKGLLAQIGRPREVYENPKSEFVAGFVGTTNRLAGKLFRPEAVRLDETGPHQGRVVSAFFLGDRQRIVAELDGANIVADLPVAASLVPGGPIRFAVERHIEIARPC
jgi:putative spermidine/putrescine transport system ATP-binding protein